MCDNHPPLTGSEILRGVEAEANGVTPVTLLRMTFADRMPLVVRADRMRSIFNYEQTLVAANAPDRIHVTRQTVNMDWYNRTRSIRYFSAYRFRIDVAIVPNIGQHRSCSGVKDGIDGGTERHRRRDHLISRAQA